MPDAVPLSDEDLAYTLEALTGDDAERCAIALRVLSDAPAGDERLLAPIEALLDDRRPCLIQIPFVYAEIRWLAAQALAAERGLLGIDAPVHLEAIEPLTTNALAEAEERAGVRGHGSALERFAQLQEIEALPIVQLDIGPYPPTG